MDKELWLQIAEHYKIAKRCLWCPKHASNWRRDEDQGMFHLWQAYYAAICASEKENLLYARVLMMMNDENYNCSCYERFHKYLSPAMDAYNLALASPDSRKPTEKELQKIRFLFETTQYEVRKKSGTEEELNAAYAQIEGLNAVQEFQIHDSKPIYFSQDDFTAILKLQFEDVTVTLQFWDLYDIQISCDPLANWITEFYCYPSYYDSNQIIFDIGYYQILCKKIQVIDVCRSARSKS